jgi:hypothetical protein
MPASYKIVLTPLAKAAADKYESAAALEAEVRAQIRHLFADEASYANMLFHTFEMAGQEYICAPEDMDGEIVLLVDTCSRRDGKPLEKGPLAGQTLSYPKPDSD